MKSNKRVELDDLVRDIGNIDYKDLVPTILCYTTDRRIGKYCLQKGHKFKHGIQVRILPEQDLKYNDIDFDGLISKKYGEALLKFSEVMLTKLYYANLTNFYNNLNEIKIDTQDSKEMRDLFYNRQLGYYSAKDNEIVLNEDYASITIFHELFHMASSVYLNGIYYVGFRQYLSSSYESIGQGLNEGYTQLLTERYFGHCFDMKSPYEYESFVASKLEKIVGKYNMQELYLNANLYGLIKNLRTYASYEEIIEFISNLDYISANLNKKVNIILKSDMLAKKIKLINRFLVKTYLVKLKRDVVGGALSNDEMIVKLSQYVYSLVNDFHISDFSYCKISEDGIRDDMENMLTLVNGGKKK